MNRYQYSKDYLLGISFLTDQEFVALSLEAQKHLHLQDLLGHWQNIASILVFY